MNRKQINTSLSKHFREMNELALQYVEQEARKIMRQHPFCVEFVMGMGSWGFSTKDGDDVSYDPHYSVGSRQYLKALDDFFCDWDESLRITGNPMRFTVDGPIVTDW